MTVYDYPVRFHAEQLGERMARHQGFVESVNAGIDAADAGRVRPAEVVRLELDIRDALAGAERAEEIARALTDAIMRVLTMGDK